VGISIVFGVGVKISQAEQPCRDVSADPGTSSPDASSRVSPNIIPPPLLETYRVNNSQDDHSVRRSHEELEQ
jgi:hypothetical protein